VRHQSATGAGQQRVDRSPQEGALSAGPAPGPRSGEHAELIARLAAGDRGALARVLTLIERQPELLASLDAALAPLIGRAYTIGITGSPGAGKSTLVGAMLHEALARNLRTAVLALDPVSPITDGAILGDRMRMEEVAGDARVFVRSLGARRARGGLSLVTPFAIRALDAAGWPWIVVETVGVGQNEIDVVEAACTTVVVLTPGMGDEVQAMKAGLMEVADVFVINKADREGANQVHHDVERLVARVGGGSWQPPVIRTVASERNGISELMAAIDAHRAHLEAVGEIVVRRRRLLTLALRSLVEDELRKRLDELARGEGWTRALAAVAACEDSLGSVARRILTDIGDPSPAGGPPVRP
jgi:LAO/AO transport system kinase